MVNLSMKLLVEFKIPRRCSLHSLNKKMHLSSLIIGMQEISKGSKVHSRERLHSHRFVHPVIEVCIL